MKLSQSISGALLIVVAAFLGLALVYLPGWVLLNYERATKLGLGWLYLTVVLLGACLLIGSAISLAREIRPQLKWSKAQPSDLAGHQALAVAIHSCGQQCRQICLASSNSANIRQSGQWRSHSF